MCAKAYTEENSSRKKITKKGRLFFKSQQYHTFGIGNKRKKKWIKSKKRKKMSEMERRIIYKPALSLSS